MLSDILEDYQEADETLKKELIDEFISSVWKSKCRYSKYKKIYTYDVNDELLDDRQDLIELFNKHRIIELDFCKSFYKKKLTAADYIRVHINNMFGYLTDKNVYLSKQYYEMVMTPRNLYYIVVNKLKNNEDVNFYEIKYKIDYALEKAPLIKQSDQEKKINLSWKEYKHLINRYIGRLFNNYIPPHEYEKEHGWEMKVNINGWSDDNFAVKYFCRSLTGYMQNYVRDSKEKIIKEKHCVTCGNKIENTSNRRKYCQTCARLSKNEQNKRYYHLGK